MDDLAANGSGCYFSIDPPALITPVGGPTASPFPASAPRHSGSYLGPGVARPGLIISAATYWSGRAIRMNESINDLLLLLSAQTPRALALFCVGLTRPEALSLTPGRISLKGPILKNNLSLPFCIPKSNQNFPLPQGGHHGERIQARAPGSMRFVIS